MRSIVPTSGRRVSRGRVLGVLMVLAVLMGGVTWFNANFQIVPRDGLAPPQQKAVSINKRYIESNRVEHTHLHHPVVHPKHPVHPNHIEPPKKHPLRTRTISRPKVTQRPHVRQVTNLDSEPVPVVTKATPADTPSDSSKLNGASCMDKTADQNECRRKFIKKMMKRAWTAYKENAWGSNELDPIRNTAYSGSAGLFAGQSGATVIDSLDTLYIMDMQEELAEARKWVKDTLNFNINSMGSVFEISIRYFAGLLSAYALTKDDLYKEKAKDIGDRLFKAFDTPTRVPYGTVNLATGAVGTHWVPCKCAILSEMGSMTMEFRYLSNLTGDPKYAEAVTQAMKTVTSADLSTHHGLYPFYINLQSGALSGSSYRFGAMSDSFYEYLFKDWRFQGGLDTYDTGRQSFDKLMQSAKTKLMKTSRDGFLYVGDIESGRFVSHMEHLSCFLPGTLAMASQGAVDEETSKWYLESAEGLTRTCHDGYDRTATKLGPELMEFDRGGGAEVNPNRAFYWLRPETVESYFYLWRITNDPKYREWAWEAAMAIERECKCGSGYCGLNNVQRPQDFHAVQESYFLAETLKYLFLIFSDDTVIDINRWVFNTEAHPLPVQAKHVDLATQ